MKVKTNTVLIVVALLAYWVGLSNASAFYDPGAQRWPNRDPLGDNGSLAYNLTSVDSKRLERVAATAQGRLDIWTGINLNLFGSMGNNPVTHIDPWGEDWLYCLNNCMKKFDPVPSPTAKAALLCLGPFPKPFVTPGSTPYSNVPRKFFGLKGLGRSWLVKYVTIPGAVIYGSYLAGLEASCAATCGIDDTNI